MRGGPQRWLVCLYIGTLLLFGAAGCGSSTVKAIPAPTATPGAITLTPDRSVYTPMEPFGITVTSKAAANVFALDGRTGCTFLELQEYIVAKNGWAPVNLCRTGDLPQAYVIPPGAAEPFTLAPGDSPSNQNEWADGTYRVVLTYNTQRDGKGTSQTVYSQGFVVRG